MKIFSFNKLHSNEQLFKIQNMGIFLFHLPVVVGAGGWGGGGGEKKGRGYKSNLWTSHYLSPRGGGWRILVMSQQKLPD